MLQLTSPTTRTMVMAPFSLACLALGGRVVTAEMPAFVGGSTATRPAGHNGLLSATDSAVNGKCYGAYLVSSSPSSSQKLGGRKSRRRIPSSLVSHRAVVENETGQGDPHTTPPPGIGDGGVDSAAVNSAKGGGTKEWEGLGAWEGLGEGLSGVWFYAQQGLEGFKLPTVPETWMGIDLPELPALPELPPFALPTWTDQPKDTVAAEKAGVSSDSPQAPIGSQEEIAAEEAANPAGVDANRGGRLWGFRRKWGRKRAAAVDMEDPGVGLSGGDSASAKGNVGGDEVDCSDSVERGDGVGDGREGRLSRWRKGVGLGRRTSRALQGLKARLPGLGHGGNRKADDEDGTISMTPTGRVSSSSRAAQLSMPNLPPLKADASVVSTDTYSKPKSTYAKSSTSTISEKPRSSYGSSTTPTIPLGRMSGESTKKPKSSPTQKQKPAWSKSSSAALKSSKGTSSSRQDSSGSVVSETTSSLPLPSASPTSVSSASRDTGATLATPTTEETGETQSVASSGAMPAVARGGNIATRAANGVGVEDDTAVGVVSSAPPLNAWKILSSKASTATEAVNPRVSEPVQEQEILDPGSDRTQQKQQQSQQQQQQQQQQSEQQPRPSFTSPPLDDKGDRFGTDADEIHAFGDVELSVQKIPQPPEMEITVNRRSGTPAKAAARPAAAAAAKAAAESENVLEEWVDGEPVNTQQQGRSKRQARRPRAPADLAGLTGEMRLVEMACLTGLSSGAGKSAGLIMHEQLGFGCLLRGLRDDVRPSLRRRVLQAITTLVDSDPSLAPFLLGVDPEHHTDEKTTASTKTSDSKEAATKKATGAGAGASRDANAMHSGGAAAALGRGVRKTLRGAARRGAGGEFNGEAAAAREDKLIERITAILGYHSMGSSSFTSDANAGWTPIFGSFFGLGGGAKGGEREGNRVGGGVDGVGGRVGRAVRAAVQLVPLPGIRPSSLPAAVVSTSVGAPAAFMRAAAAASAATGRAIAGVGVGGGVSGLGTGRAGGAAAAAAYRDRKAGPKVDADGAEEGRDWWKDDVALEEEEFEHEAVSLSTGGGWGWWWGHGRVSRERLVEEALELTFRLVMSGDVALEALQGDAMLIAALRRVADGGGQRLQYDAMGALKRVGAPLTHSQKLANKILGALGAHRWVPKTLGQKGVRILCFDGGGTRGVLSLALLKHVEKALGGRQPHEVFDMIVGTSTGGIIAALAGVITYPVAKCSNMYDSLINKIFIKHPAGGMKLALKQAFYDEVGWMNILSNILGDQLLIDSAVDPLRPMVLCPSTLISSNPAKVMLWRSYNYPPGHERSRYYGSFRHMVRQAVRATTAAPTFFAPLMINGALYSDGALLCNNPSAVAYHEAKRVFPGVPVEAIVSLGTGCFFEEKNQFMEPTVGWGGIINQVIASATETEITTDIVSDMLPPDVFFRFNPRMTDMPIDEVKKERLDDLKTLANDYFKAPQNQERLQELATKFLPQL